MEDDVMEAAAKKQDFKFKLRVIIHGLVAIVQNKHSIDVILPDVGPEHVYRAGNWLVEAAFERGGSHRLKGVKGGQARFDENLNLIIKGLKLAPSTYPPPIAKLEFPTPEKIHSLRPVMIHSGMFDAGDHELPENGMVATVQVFEYSFADIKDLKLGNHAWVPRFASSKPQVNLHVLCEPERILDAHHPARAFDAGVRLFEDLHLRMTHLEEEEMEMEDEILPEGVSAMELNALVQRNVMLGSLADQLRVAEDETMVVPLIPVGIDGTCIFVVSDNSGGG